VERGRGNKVKILIEREYDLSFAGRVAFGLSVLIILSVISGTGMANYMPPPVAAFTYNPCVMCAAPGDVISFNANYSISTGGTIQSYSWDFGDGTPLSTTNSSSTTHMFCGQPGQWQVTLTVVDANGQADTVSQLVIFNIAPRLTFQPSRPETGQTVTFNACSTGLYFNSTQSPKEFQWNFGDGVNATGTLVDHVYHTVTIDRVTLSVVTAEGNATISQTITVSPDPPSSGGGDRALPVYQRLLSGSLATCSENYFLDL
jgi:PKD repeat protein